MKEKIWVKALVDPKLHTKVPNVPIILWGHTFHTQIDGSLCMEMDADFVKAEVRAGRVRVLEKPPPGKSNELMAAKVVVIDKTAFTLNIGSYYGTGSLNNLIEKVSTMTKEEMIDFANERFPKNNITRNMKDDTILDKIRSLADIAYIEYEEQKNLSEDND